MVRNVDLEGAGLQWLAGDHPASFFPCEVHLAPGGVAFEVVVDLGGHALLLGLADEDFARGVVFLGGEDGCDVDVVVAVVVGVVLGPLKGVAFHGFKEAAGDVTGFEVSAYIVLPEEKVADKAAAQEGEDQEYPEEGTPCFAAGTFCFGGWG